MEVCLLDETTPDLNRFRKRKKTEMMISLPCSVRLPPFIGSLFSRKCTFTSCSISAFPNSTKAPVPVLLATSEPFLEPMVTTETSKFSVPIEATLLETESFTLVMADAIARVPPTVLFTMVFLLKQRKMVNSEFINEGF